MKTFSLMSFLLTALLLIGILLGYTLARAPGSRAIEVRLIGHCDGKLLAAMEEDNFPASGCSWIEPINFHAGA